MPLFMAAIGAFMIEDILESGTLPFPSMGLIKGSTTLPSREEPIGMFKPVESKKTLSPEQNPSTKLNGVMKKTGPSISVTMPIVSLAVSLDMILTMSLMLTLSPLAVIMVALILMTSPKATE